MTGKALFNPATGCPLSTRRSFATAASPMLASAGPLGESTTARADRTLWGERVDFDLSALLHLVAAVIWVGGMFFAYMALRPVAGRLLEPPLGLRLWSEVLQVFFAWVWVLVMVLWTTGLWLLVSRFSGIAQIPLYVHLMTGLAAVMTLIFSFTFFGPYRYLRAAVTRGLWTEANFELTRVRRLVATNLALGLVLVSAVGARWIT